MKSNELNLILREMFKGLVDQDYKKNPMCSVTLGPAFNPQFTKFLEGTDLGLSPLTRMIEGLGYELHLVPVKDEDIETNRVLDDQYKKFIEDSRSSLIEFLENRPAPTRAPSNGGAVQQVFDETIEEIFENIK